MSEENEIVCPCCGAHLRVYAAVQSTCEIFFKRTQTASRCPSAPFGWHVLVRGADSEGMYDQCEYCGQVWKVQTWMMVAS